MSAASSTASQAPAAPSIPVQPGTSASNPLVVQIVGVPQAPSTEPHWTVYWSTFATPLVALVAAAIAASIAYRQWKTAAAAVATAKNKLKLDLFERRFNVFQATSRLIVRMTQDTVHDDKAISTLLGETAGAEFLFDETVHGYLVEQLYVRAGNIMRRQHEMLAAQKNDVNLFNKLADEQCVEMEWFEGQLDAWTNMTRPFLELTH